MLEDIRRMVCPYLFASLRPKYRSVYNDDANPRTLAVAQVTTPVGLSELALVCKVFHEELQVHRKKQVDKAVAHWIDEASFDIFFLVNINMYKPPSWAALCDDADAHMLYMVYLGPHAVYQINLKRQRLSKSDVSASDELELSVSCGVREKNAGGPWMKTKPNDRFLVDVHATCMVHMSEYAPGDREAHSAWYNETRATVRAWLEEQYEQMTV
jgi:hypothetical protein